MKISIENNIYMYIYEMLIAEKGSKKTVMFHLIE